MDIGWFVLPLIGFILGGFLKSLFGNKSKRIVLYRKTTRKPTVKHDNTIRVTESKVYSDNEFELK